MRKSPHPCNRRRALGIVLRQGARGALFLMSEVPLYYSFDMLGVRCTPVKFSARWLLAILQDSSRRETNPGPPIFVSLVSGTHQYEHSAQRP